MFRFRPQVESLEGREAPVFLRPFAIQHVVRLHLITVRQVVHASPPAPAAAHPATGSIVSAPDLAAPGIPLPFSNINFQPITAGEFDNVRGLGTDHSSIVGLPPWAQR